MAFPITATTAGPERPAAALITRALRTARSIAGAFAEMIRRGGAPGGRLEQYAGRVERRSEEHTSELQSLMRISYAVFCLKKKKKKDSYTSKKRLTTAYRTTLQRQCDMRK